MYIDGYIKEESKAMYYSFKEIVDMDDTPYDDSLTDAYVAEYGSSIVSEVSDNTSTEVEGFSDDALFEPLRELED